MNEKQGTTHLVHLSLETEDVDKHRVLLRVFHVNDATGARALESATIMKRKDCERLLDEYKAKSRKPARVEGTKT